MLIVADAPPATWTNSDQSEVALDIVYDPSKNELSFTETPEAISSPWTPVVRVPLISTILDPSYLTTAFTEPLSRTGSIDTSSLLLLRFPEVGGLNPLLNHLFHCWVTHLFIGRCSLPNFINPHTVFTPLCFDCVTLFALVRTLSTHRPMVLYPSCCSVLDTDNRVFVGTFSVLLPMSSSHNLKTPS